MPETTEQKVERFKRAETGQLLDFLNYATYLRALRPATAQSYRTAVEQVLSAVGHGVRDQDVREIDVEEHLALFELKRQDLSESTRSGYSSRFQKAVGLYRRWLDDPENFRGFRPPSVQGSSGFVTLSEMILSSPIVSGAPATGGPTDEVVPYPFPLADGRMALLVLPQPLTRADAERLSQFVLSLATQLPAPATDPAPDFQFLDADENHVVGEVKSRRRSPNAPSPPTRDESG